jgi:hypothetical protein
MGSVGVPVIPENDVVTPTSVTKQPFVRSLFKPQNTGNMIKSDSQSLAFRLHVCKFDPIGVLTLQNDASTDAVLDINEYRFNCAEILPENTKITHVAQVGEDSATEIDSNKNIVPADGSISYVSNSQGGVVEIVSTMRASSDYYVSPVIDVERSSFLKISNIINNNNVSVSGDPLYNGELEPDNALANANNKAKARYITKKVTLEEGLEAENITVMMSLCNPISPSGESSIKVFVRPIPVGEVDLDNINYVELTTSDSKYSSSTSDFREVSYTNIGSVSLNKFRTFSVKVVLFGPGDGSAVPKIRNLRVVAT